MNGIRYASGCIGLGRSSNLLCEGPINFCRQTGMFGRKIAGLRSLCHSRVMSTKKIDSATRRTAVDLSSGPDLADFILAKTNLKNKVEAEQIPYMKNINGNNRTVHFEVYGCQMNVNDADVAWAILRKNGYKKAADIDSADVVLLVTCSIRESAEEKIWNKLDYLKSIKAKKTTKHNPNPMKIGILGCMAKRLKDQIFEKNAAVDVIAGPDSYKHLPHLLATAESNETAINVVLSYDETYADITPVRLNDDACSAFVSIMRGCDNMCTYCVVPFTRGRERSRPIESILGEIRQLSDQGIKEVTLLGQNVNSYRDLSQSNFYTAPETPSNLAKGFKTVYKTKIGGLRFSDLLDKVSMINPEMRIRFTSPHPKDFPDEVLHLIAERPNICRQLHLPAQSGNSKVLERMRRGYTREAYLELVQHVRSIIPNVSLSSDFIAGFCGETDEEFDDTLTLLEEVEYNKTFLFAYSMRERTTAHRRFVDDVPTVVKKQRLTRMIDLSKIRTEKLNHQQIGTHQLVLIEGKGRRTGETLVGRNDGNTRVVIPNGAIPADSKTHQHSAIQPGDYVVVQICRSNFNSLSGIPLYHSTLSGHAESQPEPDRRQIFATS